MTIRVADEEQICTGLHFSAGWLSYVDIIIDQKTCFKNMLMFPLVVGCNALKKTADCRSKRLLCFVKVVFFSSACNLKYYLI